MSVYRCVSVSVCVCVCAGLTTRTHISRGTKRDGKSLLDSRCSLCCGPVSVRLCVGLTVCVSDRVRCVCVCSVCVRVCVRSVLCVCVCAMCVCVCVRGLECVCAFHMCLSVKGLVCVALLLYVRTGISHGPKGDKADMILIFDYKTQ